MKNSIHPLLRKIQIACLVLLTFLCCITQAKAQGKDSQGKDFWLMYNTNYDGSSTLKVFITSSVNTQGTVSIPGLSFSQPFSVTANTVTAVDLPNDLVIHTSDVIDDKGIHVTAQDEVTVYGLNYIPFTTDAYLGLPTDALGTEYLVLSYSGTTEFGIVASEDNTTVTITPSVTIGSRTAGVPYDITLNQGQSYELRGSGDLTGSSVLSDKPIGVFGANACANIPPGYGYCDHICEMLPSVDTWGTLFGTVPLKSRVNGDTWRFLASIDNTVITINGVAEAPINKGQFIEKILTDQSIIESTEPILVAQYANGSDFSGNPGDPFMMLVPPLEQFLPNYTLTTVSGYVSHYINIIARNSAVGTLTLDGTPVPASEYTPLGSTGYSGAQLTVDEGSHTLSASAPFGAFQYGFNDDDSYGYPGGQSFVPIVGISNIVLTPETGSGEVNTNQCFTALVTDDNNDPAPGVTVIFNILGANGGVDSFAVTDANGQAQFCYNGPNAGQDTIIASFGQLVDTSYFTRTGGDTSSCRKFCMIDSYRNKWNFSCAKKEGSIVTTTGTVNIGNGVIWNAWGWLDCNTGKLELHAINPQGDNCASGYTDSFVYRGITPMKCNLGNIRIGAGNWTSYCGSSVAGQGFVAAVNCGIRIPGGFSNDLITPSRSAGAETIALKVTPNPAQNYATINYKLDKESKVNIVVYNYLMQPVKTLFSGTKGAGNQTVVWDAKNSNGTAAGSGLYKIVAIVNGKTYSTTIQIIK